MQNEQYLLHPSITDTNAVGSVHAGRGQTIELLDLGKAYVHSRAAGAEHVVQHPRHPVKRLGSVDDVHLRRAGPDRVALLARHASPHPDDDPGAEALERAPAPELGEHLLLRLLPHRARVDEEHVGLLRPLRKLEPVGMGKRVRRAGGIVLVHLAAVGANEELSRRIHGSTARAQEL